jgi:hypothetical protein
MKFYILVFNRKVGVSYKAFHDDFVGDPRIRKWWHYLRSSYIVGTELSADELSHHARAKFDQHKLGNTHLVVRVDLDYRQGMLPPKAWKWIRDCAALDDDI